MGLAPQELIIAEQPPASSQVQKEELVINKGCGSEANSSYFRRSGRAKERTGGLVLQGKEEVCL